MNITKPGTNKAGLKVAFVIPPSEALKLKFVSYQQPINLAYLAASVRLSGAIPAICAPSGPN